METKLARFLVQNDRQGTACAWFCLASLSPVIIHNV